MAWSDAARAAALEARRMHAQGKQNSYGYGLAKMRQAGALFTGTVTRYRGDPQHVAAAMYHADVAHSRYANDVNPLAAAKEYLRGIKLLRGKRGTKGYSAKGVTAARNAGGGRGQAVAGYLAAQRFAKGGRR